jgi:uncharacterized RDD family membrane protein YckC
MNATVFCNKCGAQNSVDAQFCSGCGVTLMAAATATGGASSSASFPQAAPVPATGYASPAGSPLAQAGVRYGGFWIRVVAFIVDFFIVRVAIFPFKAVFGLGGLALGGLDPDSLRHGLALPYAIFGGGTLALITIAGSWLYEALMESSSYQATLGKMMFGMKVTDLYGNRISFARATGRHFAKIVSTMILFIGFIMVGFTERKQGLHDMIAGTLVRRF